MSTESPIWLYNTVSALVYALAGNHAASEEKELQAPYNDLTSFVLHQQDQMPDYLKLPMRAATLIFDLFGCLQTGHPFHNRPPQTRIRQITKWKSSKIGFQRDFIRYYESLAILALQSREATRLAALKALPQAPSARSPEANPRSKPAGFVITQPARDLEYQIAVVGSGPGGAITACLLAEAGRKVLLIEEGPYYPLESCLPFTQEEMLQKYRNGGQTVALGRNKVAYVEGRCVGGGSEINSGLYHRTPPDILERWRQEFHVEALTEEDLRPSFEACERDVTVSLLPGPAPAASLKLHEGAIAKGWKSLEVPRWFKYDGTPQVDASSHQRAELSGTRQSMTKTFVPRFLKAGGSLLPLTRVGRIRQASGKWELEAGHEDVGALKIQAETLFVCGGAVQTPALLRRSGITRNIGNTLRLHPTIKVVARFPEPVNSATMGVPVHQVKEFAPKLSFGCSISTPAYLALGLLDYPQQAQTIRQTWTHLANYYAMVAGDSHGTVRPFGPFPAPLVRYQLSMADRCELALGLHRLSELLFAAGAIALYPSLTGGPELLSPADLGKLPETLPDGLANLMTIHLFSSCPMGEDQTKCAVDSFGRVHGHQGLFVADASLLCTAPGVNPQGSIMALARRNALKFLEENP